MSKRHESDLEAGQTIGGEIVGRWLSAPGDELEDPHGFIYEVAELVADAMAPLRAERDRLREELEEERRRLTEETLDGRERYHAQTLQARDVESPCDACSGLGVRWYSSTATWAGGIGGQAITAGVCDRCWGSGDSARPWPSWRERQALAAENAGLRGSLDRLIRGCEFGPGDSTEAAEAAYDGAVAVMQDGNPLTAAVQRALEASAEILPNIGWRGTKPSDRDFYQCEWCTAEHEDCDEIPHKDGCPFVELRDAHDHLQALLEGKGEG